MKGEGTLLLLSLLCGVPLVAAFILLAVKENNARKLVVKVAALANVVLALTTVGTYYGELPFAFKIQSKAFPEIVLAVEILVCLFVLWKTFQDGRKLIGVLALVQTALVVWLELGSGIHFVSQADIVLDYLTMIMVIIIGVIGSLITVYALGYMEDFQRLDKELPDKRPYFFFVMFLFLAAMFGLILSNNLLNMYLCWEITSVTSFLLIGYTGTDEAVTNSYRALWMNLLGGLGFALALVFMGLRYHTVELTMLLKLGISGISVTLPVALLVFAGLTKAAQMPFSSWLLGAMVAPTPTSALLHSSTMVKAGVFLIIKLSPLLGDNEAGILAMFVGGITFLFASFAAISQSNGKKVLAYSTISNLGLIVACSGIGTFEAVWTAIMLVIFHAVSKSLMFLTVGTAEHHVGSRDIESFDGLFMEMRTLAVCMAIGICGMFLAPFGMLISKWAAMKAVIDAGSPFLLLVIVFGSSATFFFWTKWLGKITAIVPGRDNLEKDVHSEEWTAIKTLAGLTIIVCIVFPWISSIVVVPYLQGVYNEVVEVIGHENLIIMSSMVVLLVILPLLTFGRSHKKPVLTNLGGENLGDDLHYRGSMDVSVPVSLRNWYMDNIFGENRMKLWGGVLCVACMIISFAKLLGGVAHV
jgi:ech hydrogenase subunit A